MATEKHNSWLHRLAIFAVLCTLILIGLGGLVTSREAGLAVPDWPTSFGYNMFLFPLDQWLGKFGIFEEHSHRLMASLVGLLTAALAGWLWVRESTGRARAFALGGIIITLSLMGVRAQIMFVGMAFLAAMVAAVSIYMICKDRRALRWWGMLAYSLVIVQGVLGGLRVTQLADQIGIFHGTLAQVFLLVLASLALFNSRWWKRIRAAASHKELVPRVVRSHFFYATLLIFLQLIIGATMRHQHAGLPVWDFPKAHGQWWPATDAASIASYNASRTALQTSLHADNRIYDTQGNPAVFLSTGNPISKQHISMHMVHRVMAVLILGMVLGTVILAHRKLGAAHLLSRLSLGWLGLILVQATLGALTVLKYKPADIATLHVVCGALALGTGMMGALISRNKVLPSLVKNSVNKAELNMEATA
jgi:cytochrome c oxidase assembly protein subunit 15